MNTSANTAFWGVLTALIVYGWIHPQHTDDSALGVYYLDGAYTNYHADRQSQTVVAQIFGGYRDKEPLIYPVKPCVVFDSRNWSCESAYAVSAFDGRVTVSDVETRHQLPWWKWKIVNLRRQYLWEDPKPEQKP